MPLKYTPAFKSVDIMALTDPKIRQAKPKDKDYKLSDAKGMFLLVTKKGAKYWRLKYRSSGKEKRLAIGVYPRVTLKSARKACEASKDYLQQGIDPSQAKKAKKIEQVQSQLNNLEAISREWHTQQSKKWSDSYAVKVIRAMGPSLSLILTSRINFMAL